MKNQISKIKYIVYILLLSLPLSISAQTRRGRVGVDESDVVPVPEIGGLGGGGFFSSLIYRGPAGEISATGLILSIINIALAIVGFISVLYIIIGGFRYVMAAGNEEAATTAKKTILHAVVGLAVAILAFVVVRIVSNLLLYGSLAA